jgi:hypothetical protein
MLKMICHDLKTVIIEYVHDDGQIKEISEWEKACCWNRSNLIKLIKYKNWLEDYITEDAFNDVKCLHNEFRLQLLHQSVQKYKYAFYAFRNVYDFANYFLHISLDMYKHKHIEKPYLYLPGSHIEIWYKHHCALDVGYYDDASLDIHKKFNNNTGHKIELCTYSRSNIVFGIKFKCIKKRDDDVLITNLEKMIENLYG